MFCDAGTWYAEHSHHGGTYEGVSSEDCRAAQDTNSRGWCSYYRNGVINHGIYLKLITGCLQGN